MAPRESTRARPDTDNVERFWSALVGNLEQGMVIPFIGACLIYEQVFGGLFEDSIDMPQTAASNEIRGSIMEKLTRAWADRVNYVGPDGQRLSRVAQFVQVRSVDRVIANRGYLDFLKDVLLHVASQDEDIAEIADELGAERRKLNLRQIAQELGYPRSQPEDENPLSLLAQLPLPMYITTGCHSFVEQALMREGRKPRTQICFWNGEPYSVPSEHRPDPDFEPTPAEPLVYHLYGFEQYPESLVLSDDDYFAFLVRLAQDEDPSAPLIPMSVRQAIVQSSLLLLGYHIQDWEFRVLFRGLINQRPSSLRVFSIAVQSDPSQASGKGSALAAAGHLEKYFEAAGFQVYWGTPEAFIREVWQRWQEWSYR
jgi:hypothetical protein